MEEDNRENESASDKAKFIAKVGALYSGVVALVSDILQPLLDFTLLFLFLCGFMLVTEIVLGFYTRSIEGRALNEKLLRLTDGYWFRTILIATALSFCVLLGMFLLNAGTEDGFLAEHSETIKYLQKEIGLLNRRAEEVEKNTRQTAESAKKIEKWTKDTAENTAEIAETARNAAEHAKTTADNTDKLVEQGEKTNILLEKMVNPEDARKKLAQMGVPFTVEGYASKILEGDLQTLKLFYQAGWDPLTPLGGWRGISPLFLAIARQSPNYLDVLAQAIEEGHFNPNKKIKIDIFSAFPNLEEQLEWLTCNGYSIIKSFLGDENERNLFKNFPSLTTGDLLSTLILIPDEEVCSFITKYKLQISEGIIIREVIAEMGYITYLKIIPQFIIRINRNKQEEKSFTRKELISIQQLRSWCSPARLDDIGKRLEEYAQGTNGLNKALVAGAGFTSPGPMW